MKKLSHLFNFQLSTSTIMRSLPGMLLFLMSFLTASAQTFPVQSSLQLTPPYSLKLPDYVSPGTERMVLNALLTDISRAQLDVELRLTIEGQGILIQTSPTFNPEPITLISGVNIRLSGLDLEPYFRAENLDFLGIGEQEFMTNGGSLPEGIYRFCIEIVEFNREVAVARSSCATAWLVLNDPPIINLPGQGEKLEPIEPQYVRFQWTPRHTGSPNSAFSTEYDFTLVEVWPSDRNPNDAILTTTPIYETSTMATSLVYGPAEPALVRGRHYAFRVQARNVTGVEPLDLFRNDGFSEVQHFIYGDECITPDNVSASSFSSRKIDVYWDADPVHTGFLVKYRKQGDVSWMEEKVLFNDYTLTGLIPDTEYEIQVVGICGSSTSEESNIYKTKTEAEIEGDFSCGAPPESFNLDNTSPLPSLKEGDVIRAGDFDVSMIEVTGSNGTFSGKGQIVLPMMNHVKAGTEFSNIKVNDEFRMYDGQMHFTAMTAQVLTDEQLELVEEAFDYIEELEEDIMGVLDVAQEVADSINSIVEEMQNTDVFTEEEYEEFISDETGVEELREMVTDALEAAAQAAASGDIVEAAKQISIAQAANSRAKTINEQTSQVDTVQNAAVRFVAGTYGMDVGPGHNGIEPNYYKIITDQGDEYGPWFSAEEGNSLVITTEWISDSGVPKDSITFTLADAAIDATATNEGWDLSIPSGTADEKRVLKALYNGNTVGIAAVVFYKLESRKVTLVKVNGATMPTGDEAQSYLNEVFGPAIVEWEVATAEVTVDNSWDLNSNGSMYVEENNDLSVYPDEVKALNSAVKAALGTVENDRYYVLFTNIENSADAGGFMPRKKQFGLVFDGKTHTLAHELGHGAFRLAHTWEDHPNLSPGDTENLMDYTPDEKKNLRQYQWDEIHNPKWVISLFDDEEEGQIGGVVWFTPNWKLFKVEGTNSLSVRYSSTKVPGTVPGFTKDGKKYFAEFEGDEFIGYYYNFADEGNREKYEFVEISPVDQGSEPVYLYEYNGGCGVDKYYKSTYSYVKDNNYLNVLSGLENGTTINCSGDNDLDKLCKEGREYYELYESSYLSDSEKDFLYKVADELICEAGSAELIAAQLSQYKHWESRAKSIAEIIAGNPFSFEKYYNALVSLKDWRDNGLVKFSDSDLSSFSEEKREEIRDQIFDVVYQLHPDVISLLSLDRKLKILTVMLDGKLFSFSKNHEALVVKLIKSIKDSEAAQFLDIMVAAKYKNSDDEPLIYQLKERLGDFIGNDYTEFFKEIKRLSDARSKLSGEELDVKVYLEWNVEQKDYVIISMVKNQNDYTFIYDENDHTVHIRTCINCCSSGRKNCSAEYDYLLPQKSSPFDLVGLTIINDVSPFGSGCKDGSSLGSNEYCGEVQIVPAIFLDYLKEKENSQRLTNFGWNVFNVVITVATFGEGAAAIAAVRTASAGTRMYVAAKNAYTLIDFTYTVTDMALKAADVKTPKAWAYIGYAFAAKTSYDLLKNGGAKGIGHLKKLVSEGKTDEALEIIEEMGVKKNGEVMTKSDLETFIAESSTKIEGSGNSQLIDDYNAGFTGKIDLDGTTWDKVIGTKINDLEDAPKGYEFYKVGDSEWIRRIDANNPETPRLTVDGDGKIIQYVYSDAHQVLLNKLDDLSLEVPSLRKWMEGLTNNTLFSKIGELDANALRKLESDLSEDTLNALKGAFKEDPDLMTSWKNAYEKGITDAMRKNPEILKRTKSFTCD